MLQFLQKNTKFYPKCYANQDMNIYGNEDLEYIAEFISTICSV
jgi:hypothetical protein